MFNQTPRHLYTCTYLYHITSKCPFLEKKLFKTMQLQNCSFNAFILFFNKLIHRIKSHISFDWMVAEWRLTGDWLVSLATIYAEIAVCSHAIGVTIYALNFEKNCRRRQNLSLTLNQIAAANSTGGAIKYKILPLLNHKT